MTPFEELIKELGTKMRLDLRVDPHQSCRIDFGDSVQIQIDLDRNGDKILVGSTLGILSNGSLREKILTEALRVNGFSDEPRGTLAFSRRNDSFILFQYIPIQSLDGERLFHFLMKFLDHAKIWIQALLKGEVPETQFLFEKAPK